MAKHSVTEFLGAFTSIAQQFYDLEHDLLITLDETGGIERVNPAFTKATGYGEGEVLRIPVNRLVVMDDWAIFFRSFTDIHHPPFRLLHKGEGSVKVYLLDKLFDPVVDLSNPTREKGVRCLLILRQVKV